MRNCICHCNDSKKEKGSQAGGALCAPPARDVFLVVIAVTSAIVHGQRPSVYVQVCGVRFHAVGAVTGCIGMVNVSSAWLTGGMSKNVLPACQAMRRLLESPGSIFRV